MQLLNDLIKTITEEFMLFNNSLGSNAPKALILQPCTTAPSASNMAAVSRSSDGLQLPMHRARRTGRCVARFMSVARNRDEPDERAAVCRLLHPGRCLSRDAF